MVALNTPYWDTITAEMRQVMAHIGKQPFASRFYLAGGTALALQIGHRRSVDLDFFSEIDELGQMSRDEITTTLSAFPLEIIENVGGNLLVLVEGVRTGFFGCGCPLLEKPHLFENILLAPLVDIGLMKCDALITRGGRKDFYDLYYIMQYHSLDTLIRLGQKKYAYFRDFPLMVLESMTLFDNGDRDAQPEILYGPSWEALKQFFLEQARQLSNHWFKDS